MKGYILITGSSGFIGRRLTSHFLKLNYGVIGIDIKKSKVTSDAYVHIQKDLTDIFFISSTIDIIKTYKIIATFHLAAKIKVGSSMLNPAKYYNNNIIGLYNLLNLLLTIKSYNIIFSSTAAVYGSESIQAYTETEAGGKLSVYGHTKLMGEEILKFYSIYGFKGYIFRFFNVSGEYVSPVHLIDIIVHNLKKGESITIFGTDYPTRDGTCLRDYIHVDDISNAFDKAITKGFDHKSFIILNLGSSTGYTVKEIITKTMELTGLNTQIINGDKRSGDAVATLSDISLVKEILDWKPTKALDDIIKDTIVTYK